MARGPVLVVDDNLVNLKLVRVVLTSAGYEVHTAESAEQAEEVLKTLRPQVILMDLQLPGISGLELTRRLKADARLAGTAIIAVTAYAMKGDREAALAAGCDEYVAKPIDTRALPGLVGSFARG